MFHVKHLKFVFRGPDENRTHISAMRKQYFTTKLRAHGNVSRETFIQPSISLWLSYFPLLRLSLFFFGFSSQILLIPCQKACLIPLVSVLSTSIIIFRLFQYFFQQYIQYHAQLWEMARVFNESIISFPLILTF